jgi:hypothetical protein
MNKDLSQTVRVILDKRIKIGPDTSKPEHPTAILGVSKATRDIVELLSHRDRQINKLLGDRAALRAELDAITGSDSPDPDQRLTALIKRKQAIEGEITELGNFLSREDQTAQETHEAKVV